MNNLIPEIQQLFHRAKELGSTEAREAFLDTACKGKPQTRAEVVALLNAADRGEKLFQRVEAALQNLRRSSHYRSGDRLGPYQIREVIGEGGMGVVYLAEQTEPIQRRVAVKEIKVGTENSHFAARFLAEGKALARMDHPNIARIYDAGVGPSGRPFFVMELVHGRPLIDFSKAKNLSVIERIKLFIPICHAVQSAHQKGIIHRDLKPSNILIAEEQGGPARPVVIDFGIAKAIEGDGENAGFTAAKTMLGTPAYMSPEQAQMDSDVDTRSDIYSLGALLYELITGEPPFEQNRLRQASFAEMQRILREEEPNPFSSNETACGSDLECIVLTCLAKDRNCRYETAAALAADLEAYLEMRPIKARPATEFYRFTRFVQRHRVASASVMIVTLTIVLSSLVSLRMALAARRERAMAERRLQHALSFVDTVFSEVSQSLQNLIGGSRANNSLNKAGIKLMTALESDAGGNPNYQASLGLLQIQLAYGMGWFGGNTSADYEAAHRSATQAVQNILHARSVLSPQEAQIRLIRAETVAGYAMLELERHSEALQHFREMQRWALLLSDNQDANWAREGQKQLRWARGSMGEALYGLGRLEEAMTNYFLPVYRESEARGVSENSRDWLDLHDMAAGCTSLGRVHGKLGHEAESLEYLAKAERLLARLVALYSNDAQVASEYAIAKAELGAALLRFGKEDGLKTLETAAGLAKKLVKTDPLNANFAECEVKVLFGFAQGLAEGRQSRPEDVRRMLDQAELALVDFEKRFGRKAAQKFADQARRAALPHADRRQTQR